MGTVAGYYGQFSGRRLSISLEKNAKVFQAEMYAILEYAFKIRMDVRPEKYVSIFSVNQAALKSLQAIKSTSPLVQQC